MRNTTGDSGYSWQYQRKGEIRETANRIKTGATYIDVVRAFACSSDWSQSRVWRKTSLHKPVSAQRLREGQEEREDGRWDERRK